MQHPVVWFLLRHGGRIRVERVRGEDGNPVREGAFVGLCSRGSAAVFVQQVELLLIAVQGAIRVAPPVAEKLAGPYAVLDQYAATVYQCRATCVLCNMI